MSNSSILNFVNSLEQIYKFLFLPSITLNRENIAINDTPSKKVETCIISKLRKSIFRIIHAFFVLFCVFYVSLYSLYDFYINDFKPFVRLTTLLVLFMLFSNSLFYVLSARLFFSKTETTRSLFRKLGEMQVELEGLANVKLETKSYYIVVISVHLLEMALGSLMAISAFQLMVQGEVKMTLMLWNYMHSQLIQGVFAVKVCVLVLTFKNMFMLINANIALMLQNVPEKECQIVDRCKIIKRSHTEVVKLIKLTNGLHSAPLIGLALYYQATILFSFYSIWMDPDEDVGEDIKMLFFTSTCLVKILLINFLTHRCKREGLQLAKMEVAKAISTATGRNSSPGLIEELKSFALQLLHSDFDVKGGYYQFGGPFVFAYFSEIFTRTIILVQFKEIKSTAFQ